MEDEGLNWKLIALTVVITIAVCVGVGFAVSTIAQHYG